MCGVGVPWDAADGPPEVGPGGDKVSVILGAGPKRRALQDVSGGLGAAH